MAPRAHNKPHDVQQMIYFTTSNITNNDNNNNNSNSNIDKNSSNRKQRNRTKLNFKNSY